MKVHVYPEGGYPVDGLDYESSPVNAAAQYCEHEQNDFDANIIVTPLDEEACALPGWHADEDEPAFKMVRVTVRRTYTAREVDTFNPHYKVTA